MTTLLISQPNFESHVTPTCHPERPDRIRAIEEALAAPEFAGLIRRTALTGDLSLAEQWVRWRDARAQREADLAG